MKRCPNANSSTTNRLRFTRLPVGLLAALLVHGCADATEETGQPEAPRVRHAEVRLAEPTETRTFVGRTRGGTESRVGPRIDGALLEVPVSVGDSVETGDTVARIDPEPQEMQRRTAETRIERAEAQLDYARETYERVRELYRRDLAALSEYEEARTALESAEAAVEQARSATELRDLELEYTEVEAPVSGTIARQLADEGETVTAGFPVVVIVADGPWEVHLSVPDTFSRRVEAGDEVDVHIDGVDASPLRGTVSGVAGAAEPGAGTFPVVVEIIEQVEMLRSGMVAEVTFTDLRTRDPDADAHGDTAESRSEGELPLLVPATAVEGDAQEERQYVYRLARGSRVGEPTEVRETPVQTGRLVDDCIEILEGLREGERVVSLGVSRLSDGQQVIPMEPDRK